MPESETECPMNKFEVGDVGLRGARNRIVSGTIIIY